MLRRRGKSRGSRDQAHDQAQAALGNVANHAEAGQRAQRGNPDPMWAPPPTWSQALSAQAPTAPEPAPPARPQPAMLPPVPPPVPPAAPPVPPTPPKPAASAETAPAKASSAEPRVAPDAAVALPVAEIASQLVRVLDTVSTMCERVISTLESERAERRLMLEAMTKLVERVNQAPVYAPSNGNGARLVGGSVEAIVPTTIDLREPDTPVEVKCRFGDRWVDGFEICEVLREGANVRYRLRRRVDSVVLPELFDASDIRHVETFEELTSTPRQQRQWSSL